MSSEHICPHCSKSFDDIKKLSNHTPDCYRKYTENPPERLCSKCLCDYTRKSGSAYRTHMKKCNNVDENDILFQTQSAIKQCDRRKQILYNVSCVHCNECYSNITVGQFGDHRYKCKKNIPNYDKEYQTNYRNEMNRINRFIKTKYPNMKT